MSDVLVQVQAQDDLLVQVENLAREVVVAVGIQGPMGPSGPAAGDAVYLAGIALGGHRMVVLDASEQLIYADNSDLSHAEKVIGMTAAASSAAANTLVKRSGTLEEPSWSWTLGTPIFLGVNGLLTQVRPTTAAFVLQVAFPITPTKVFIDIKQAFLI